MIRVNIKLNSPIVVKNRTLALSHDYTNWQTVKAVERNLNNAEKLPEQLLRALKQCERGKHKVAYESTGAITRSFRI